MKLNIRFKAGVIFLLFIVVFSGCSLQNIKAIQNDQMRFEHIALNVDDPVAVADWYCKHLDMKIQRVADPPFNTRFVSDRDGNMMFEFYHNANASIPDYFMMDPGSLHIGFVVDDVETVFEKLRCAGATIEKKPEQVSTGDTICMLRDPWGVPIQFLKRQDAMLDDKKPKKN